MTTEEQRELSTAQLHHLIRPEYTIYHVKRSTSSNGLTSWHDFYVIFQPVLLPPYLAYLTGHIANVLGIKRTVQGLKLEGIKPVDVVSQIEKLLDFRLFHQSI